MESTKIGTTHGLYTVVEQRPSNRYGLRWLVRCQCGKERDISQTDLARTKSCHKCAIVKQRVVPPICEIPGALWLPLACGKLTLVEAADYEALNLFKWHIAGGYPSRKIGYSREYIHRKLLELPEKDPREGDHINGNKLDNRRSNLRIATSKENSRNAAKKRGNNPYKGVFYRRGEWRAHIGVDSANIDLGAFDSAENAAIAYDAAAVQFHKEFARLNFPIRIDN